MPGAECCHNNGVKTDCRLTNLRWDTHAGNMSDKERHGTIQFGDRHPRTLIPDNTVLAVREYVLAMRRQAVATYSGRHPRKSARLPKNARQHIAETFGLSIEQVKTIIEGANRKRIGRFEKVYGRD